MTAIVIFFSPRRGIRLPAGLSVRCVDAAGLPGSVSRGGFTSKHEAIRGMSAK
jgi:hypothetical protein